MNSQRKYKTTMLKSNLSDNSDGSILVKEIIKFSEIQTQHHIETVHNWYLKTKNIDIAMPFYNM